MSQQWEAYERIAADEATRRTERFQNAGTYANWLETPTTTDEEWAEAFFNAYRATPSDTES